MLGLALGERFDAASRALFPVLRAVRDDMLASAGKSDLRKGENGYVVPWNGCGHGRNAGRGGGWRGQTDCRGVERTCGLQDGPSGLGGAGSRRLVARGAGGHSRRAGRGARAARADCRHRADRADARRRDARRERPGAAPVADLVRYAHPAAVRLADGEDRLRAADRADLQSCAAQLHADQAAVGQGARAGDLRQDPPHSCAPRTMCATG